MPSLSQLCCWMLMSLQSEAVCQFFFERVFSSFKRLMLSFFCALGRSEHISAHSNHGDAAWAGQRGSSHPECRRLPPAPEPAALISVPPTQPLSGSRSSLTCTRVHSLFCVLNVEMQSRCCLFFYIFFTVCASCVYNIYLYIYIIYIYTHKHKHKNSARLW